MDSRKSSDDYNSCMTSMSDVEEIAFQTFNGLNLNLISNGIYTNESQKRIDFVLVFRTKDENNSKARKIFETNLLEEGLLLEYTESTNGGEYTYVQIYAPWDLLTRYAEVMKLRMPMKTIQSNMRILFDTEYSDRSMVFTAPYSHDKEYLFDIPVDDREQFFSSSQRAQIVEFILKRKSFSQNPSDVFSIGINKLLSDNVYLAAYPLHEGKMNEDIDSLRSQLIQDWASLVSLHKNQPLERIAEYFGVKIAMYFAWVGFYTKMLVPASIIGLICFIYGLVTIRYDVPTKQICDNSTDRFMCKNCEKCDYALLSHSCGYMKASYFLDNPSTVVFAVFMSLWATFYLEMWKRYSAKITYKWDLSDFDAYEEFPRPEYLARLANRNAKRKLNVITRMEEPYVPFFRGKLPHIILSSSLVLLCIVLAIAIMLAIIAYRVSVKIAIETLDPNSEFVMTYGPIFTSLTAALINLVCILVFDRVYTKLAFYLTEKELPRTQFEFDNSLTLKMFLFQFVNYYSSIFYIAFFKGKISKHPGQVTSLISEECPVGGCFLDLAIQLAIIFVGKQAFGAIIEMLTPVLYRFYNKWKYTQNCDEKCDSLPQWEEDFLLESWDPTSLFYEYLELVLQFGFVTIFVAAFPLAPLFALINNFFEIRFDAKKIITSFKRPVAQRVKSIGIWYRILDAIGKLSVITNALIIAFTTSFVPRVLYFVENGNLNNFLNSTLSEFKVPEKDIKLINSTFCFYSDYREAPKNPTTDSPEEYIKTEYYWHLMVARLAFVVIFENVIVMLTSLMRVLIPDVPKKLVQQKRLHSYLTNELIMKHELAIAKRNATTV